MPFDRATILGGFSWGKARGSARVAQDVTSVAEFAFSRFVLDTRRRVLFRDGAPVPATPKMLDLLELLVNSSGRTIPKDEIIGKVWQGEAVSDATLVQHVLMLRKALGDEYRANAFIVTVPKQGYRFVVDTKALATTTMPRSDEAFRAYCHGQYLLQQRTVEDLNDALQWFERATLLDASFAPGYAGLAAASAMLGIYMQEPPELAFPRASSAAGRALELARDASSHTTLAEVHCYFNRNWAGALAEHGRAIELQPGSAAAHHSLAWLYVCIGDLQQALAEVTLALSLDPSSLTVAANRAVILSYLERHRDALEQFAIVLQLDPRFSLGRYLHAYALIGAGECELALSELLFVQGFRHHTRALEAECHARLGQKDLARFELTELLKSSDFPYVSPYLLARVYLALDEHELALGMLERSLHERAAWTAFALVDPIFAPLRVLSGFKSIAEAIRRGNQA